MPYKLVKPWEPKEVAWGGGSGTHMLGLWGLGL